jgi:hypothetical protein
MLGHANYVVMDSVEQVTVEVPRVFANVVDSPYKGAVRGCCCCCWWQKKLEETLSFHPLTGLIFHLVQR